MNGTSFWLYLLVMSGSTYLIRAIPFVAVQRKINNRLIRSFLYYIPYAVLTAMTLPAILYATDCVISASIGLAVAVIVALLGQGLTVVAIAACAAVFLAELFLI